jgi:hypothetical protein
MKMNSLSKSKLLITKPFIINKQQSIPFQNSLLSIPQKSSFLVPSLKQVPFQFEYIFSNPFPNYTFKSFIDEDSFNAFFIVYSYIYREDFVIKVLEYINHSKVMDHPEVSYIASIDNQYIVSAYDYFEDDKFLFLILEYCSLVT